MRTSITKRTGSRRAGLVTVAAALTLAIAPGVAFAAVLEGDGGDNEIHGTVNADTINGRGGQDRLFGSEGPDIVDGDTGADHVVGGDGNDEVIGDDGEDEMFGGTGADIMRARDGMTDRINCGDGTDTVFADSQDLFPTATNTDPKGNCEDINWVNPTVLPVALADMPEGKAGLDDPHHDYPSSDLQAPAGANIRALRGGHVEAAGWAPLGQSWCGYGVVIRGIGGGQYMYCHMYDQPDVSAGQGISPGLKIGDVGSTGQSSGNHLHLQVWKNSMQSDGYYNSVCPQRMLTAIANDNPVPLPKDLPSTGCTY
ncbi:peptidoglycan DD-metalloendopeptidase family protein [Knoellia sp. p5-6-4]|uniref:peptidoglycan DD-metalloendopeptidase family protein n=1 Tax=unclassified Knoellia TaxID=2618719 RepID=UPI0023DCAB7B|nr:peptidoglycan DD-metalloendopeptidase family protein [Knoellia sp. p5-6-4]MDF2146434.1 peptidoglycan DD-metalloendopeptidase family protein [Knoellia sp. p5-6-4]